MTYDSHHETTKPVLRQMILIVPDVYIRFDDNRTTTTNMINNLRSGSSIYENRRPQNVQRRLTLGNLLIVDLYRI